MSGAIVFRNRRFGLGPHNVRACAERDVLAAAFYAGLSTAFPEGERFFVQSVKACAQGVDPELAAAVAAFARQEGAHAREHMALNAQLAASGYAMDRILARADRHLNAYRAKPPLKQLAATIALEHFTTILARRLLSDPRHLAHCDAATEDLWRWHAVEELEHKAVAFDVFACATRTMSGMRRWFLRASTMTDALVRLARVAFANVGDILRAHGAADVFWPVRLTWFLAAAPGLLGQMLADIVAFYRPGFHPNEADDAGLIAAFAPAVAA